MKVDRVDQSKQVGGSNQLKEHQQKKSEEVEAKVTQELDKKEEVNKEELEEKIEDLNDTVQNFHEELKFRLHEESERMMVEVVDIKKDEVVKEIPPKEILDMLGRIKEMVGLLIDEKI